MLKKRFFDFFVSLILLILFFPLFLIISFSIMLNMRASVLFVQNRPGLNGKIFKMYKFRTMLDKTEILTNDELRITKFGSFLRSTSLDELPELWNVLKGDMSLVGPRPLLVEYLPLYSKEQHYRHKVLPGITGWAQVNGRNSISWEQKFEYDIWYVNNHSILLDIKILLLTLKKVFVRDGISSDCSVTMPPFRGTNNDNQ